MAFRKDILILGHQPSHLKTNDSNSAEAAPRLSDGHWRCALDLVRCVASEGLGRRQHRAQGKHLRVLGSGQTGPPRMSPPMRIRRRADCTAEKGQPPARRQAAASGPWSLLAPVLLALECAAAMRAPMHIKGLHLRHLKKGLHPLAGAEHCQAGEPPARYEGRFTAFLVRACHTPSPGPGERFVSWTLPGTGGRRHDHRGFGITTPAPGHFRLQTGNSLHSRKCSQINWRSR